jgi:YrbI family 3-deoxy-D-manno-octulosonate 8-phosphate phosphatase
MNNKESIEILAIIPARGGSKGIPLKNIKLVAGKPLIEYNIRAALESQYITRLVVSTDNPQIGKIAKDRGAEIVWRPEKISGDTASSESALLHVLKYLYENEKYQPDLIVFLQCTSPLTITEDIDGTIQALLDNKADTALAVAPFHYFIWKTTEKGLTEGINHNKSVRLRRQDREPQYIETGAVYVMKTQEFTEKEHRFFGKTAFYVMPLERVHEIDDPVDLEIAENRLRTQKVFNRLPEVPSALIMDFDGVFTDNKVIVNEDGKEAVLCNRGDGHGISLLRKTKLPMIVLSSEINPVVKSRTTKLHLECVHGLKEKKQVLIDWAHAHEIDLTDAIYIGNDVNDLSSMKIVGCSVAVQDAHPEVLKNADIILTKSGGQGAIRELCDMLIKKMGEKTHES